MTNLIRCIEHIDLPHYEGCYTSCIILTQINQLILQKRGENWPSFPDFVSAFGGRVDVGEKPEEAMIRELHEELGAPISQEELIFLGAYTEKMTDYQDIVFGYFWHDMEGKITGCYEGEALYFSDLNEIAQCPRIMDDISWLLTACQQKKLLKGL